MKVSGFYLAGHNDDLQLVDRLLPSFSLDEIDRIEPNGSTVLNAASCNGHTEIVRLLLKNGASRQQISIFDVTPVGEAKIPGIKQLFHRPTNIAHNRFMVDTLATEWMLTNWKSAIFLNNIFYVFGVNETFESLSKKIAVTGMLRDTPGLVQITYLLQQATKT